MARLADDSYIEGGLPPFAVFPGGASGRAQQPGRDVQELWFSIARLPWKSLVLVPADEGLSLGSLARSLAEVGARLHEAPVTAIVADAMDYASARMLSGMQPRLDEARPVPKALDVEAKVVGCGPQQVNGVDGGQKARLAAPLMGRVLISIQPVFREPLGIAIAQAADATVLCFKMGATRMKHARRTVELVGLDRIVGAFLAR